MRNKQLKHKAILKTSIITWTKIKNDSRMKFYFGINTTSSFFHANFFCVLEGAKTNKKFWQSQMRRCCTSKKLSQHNNFLFTLRCLKLRILDKIWHTGKAILWTHDLDAWTVGKWTLGIWTPRLWKLGRLFSGHLAFGRLGAGTLVNWAFG